MPSLVYRVAWPLGVMVGAVGAALSFSQGGHESGWSFVIATCATAVIISAFEIGKSKAGNDA